MVTRYEIAKYIPTGRMQNLRSHPRQIHDSIGALVISTGYHLYVAASIRFWRLKHPIMTEAELKDSAPQPSNKNRFSLAGMAIPSPVEMIHARYFKEQAVRRFVNPSSDPPNTIHLNFYCGFLGILHQTLIQVHITSQTHQSPSKWPTKTPNPNTTTLLPIPNPRCPTGSQSGSSSRPSSSSSSAAASSAPGAHPQTASTPTTTAPIMCAQAIMASSTLASR